MMWCAFSSLSPSLLTLHSRRGERRNQYFILGYCVSLFSPTCTWFFLFRVVYPWLQGFLNRQQLALLFLVFVISNNIGVRNDIRETILYERRVCPGEKISPSIHREEDDARLSRLSRR
jgi:hypothetical protein